MHVELDRGIIMLFAHNIRPEFYSTENARGILMLFAHTIRPECYSAETPIRHYNPDTMLDCFLRVARKPHTDSWYNSETLKPQ